MPHPLARFETEAKRLLAAALGGLDPAARPDFVYAPPPEGQGDLAAGCFPPAKALKRAPAEIAGLVADGVRARLEGNEWVADVAAAGPYVNLTADTGRLAQAVLRAAHEDPAAFGTLESKRERVILEHTSANPNGPLHVGRARNPIIGDTLVRLFRAAGHPTESQYYMDDMGKQVAILAWGLQNLDEKRVTELIGPARQDKIDHRLVRYYQAANRLMEDDENVKGAISKLIHSTETGDAAALERIHEGYTPVFKGMSETLSRLGVTFDSVVEESRFVTGGDTQRVTDRLASQTAIPVGTDGHALYLDLATKGVTGRSTKFFFRRGDGTSLYATRDVAYHLWKASQAERLVNVLGEDHKLQAKQVRTCLEALDAPHLPEVVFYSFVSLPDGKMSTRKNRVVFIDDLIDEAVERAYHEVKQRRGYELTERHMRDIAELVGVGAIRFTIIKVQCEKPIAFKWEEALSFDGFASPFIQYSHARIASLMRRADAEGVHADPDGAAWLVHPSEAALVRALARLPAVVEEAAEKCRPHLMATHAYAIAMAFNAFYRDCRVMDADTPELVRARLALVQATRAALAKSLDLLGIVAPEQM